MYPAVTGASLPCNGIGFVAVAVGRVGDQHLVDPGVGQDHNAYDAVDLLVGDVAERGAGKIDALAGTRRSILLPVIGPFVVEGLRPHEKPAVDASDWTVQQR